MILKEPDPILVADRFMPMREELLKILAELTDAQWNYPTVCTGWSVKDIALHLLGDDIGLLSRRRDGFTHNKVEFQSFEQLVAYINLQNDIWIRAARRMSPDVLLHMLYVNGRQVDKWLRSLDPQGVGAPVDWAGDGPAPQWMEIAREYTEYWIHHQHICDALGIDSLKERDYFAPVLHAFVRALPRTYAKTKAPIETLVKIVIEGDAGDTWHMVRMRKGWQLYAHSTLNPAVTITVDQETTWRLFTRGISPVEAEPFVHIEGDGGLGRVFMNTVSILA